MRYHPLRKQTSYSQLHYLYPGRILYREDGYLDDVEHEDEERLYTTRETESALEMAYRKFEESLAKARGSPKTTPITDVSPDAMVEFPHVYNLPVVERFKLTQFKSCDSSSKTSLLILLLVVVMGMVWYGRRK